MAASRVLEGYHHYKDLSGPNIGTVYVLKSDKGEFLLKKTLDKSLKKHFSQIVIKAKRLLSQSFQQVVMTTAQEDELYFEFSKRNLEDHLNACLQKDMVVSEEDLWSLLKNLAESGNLLEKLGEYHPSLTLQNIFRLNDRFKLLSPYVFDSYVDEELAISSQKKSDSRSRQSAMSKLKVNLVQAACIVLCMGILITEKELKTAQKEGHIARLLLQFQERYSARFSNIIEDVIYRRVDTFAELLDRLEGTSSKRDSVKTEVGISPPIDFNSELFASMEDSRLHNKSRDLARTTGINRQPPSSQGGKRFLGADGGLKTPTRKHDTSQAQNSPRHRAEAMHTEEGDYKLIESQNDFAEKEFSYRPRDSTRRVDFEGDINAVRGIRPVALRSGLSSVITTPKTSKMIELGHSKSQKEFSSLNGAAKPAQPSRELQNKYSESRLDHHIDKQDRPLPASRPHRELERDIASDSKRFRLPDEEVKSVSAQNFHTRQSDITGGERLDRENRVAAIYSRLNKRFKQYQDEGTTCHNQDERPRQQYDRNDSSHFETRMKEDIKQRSDIVRNTRVTEEGLYSPFNLSGTKKQIQEERAHRLVDSSQVRHQREGFHTDQPRGDRFRLIYQPNSVRESPKTQKIDENPKFQSTVDDRSLYYRPRREEDSYERYLRKDPNHFRHHITENNDITETDKKKNRSVSFNLGNSGLDYSRSYGSKTNGPKSILKKTGLDEGQGSAEKQRKNYWGKNNEPTYSNYSHSYMSQPKTDFKLETKYMGYPQKEARNFSKYEDLKGAVNDYLSRSPGYRNINFKGERTFY